MNWSSDINSLFGKYNLNSNKDFNKDGKVDEKDKQLLFEETGFFKNSEISYEDLIQLSNKKDIDESGDMSEDEQSFFNDLKNFLYEKIAKNINKDENLSINDMLELEKTVRTLDSTQKADIGAEFEKIQNRMVSNLTSQFFVSVETDEYKDAAKDMAKEVWNAQADLNKMNEEDDNPFNAKFENLLDKLGKRVEKTLSETYTKAQIKEMKEGIKGSDDGHDDTSDDTPNTDYYSPIVTGVGFEKVEDNRDHKMTLFKDGELYTGIHDDIYYKDGRAGTGTYNDIYYEQGLVKNGLSELNGNYYDHGSPATDDISYNGGTLHVENGVIKYFEKTDDNGDIVRTDYIQYAHKDDNGNTVDTSYSKITTFDGTNKDKIKTVVNYSEDGKNTKVSTETYTYNEDGSYLVVTEFEDGSPKTTDKYDIYGEKYTGNGIWNGFLYQDGVLFSGKYEKDGREYINGSKIEGKYNDKLYKDGFLYTGINKDDNLYYSEGIVKSWAVDESGTAYVNGIPAEGIYEGKYYQKGVAKDVPQGIINFILKYNIQDIKIPDLNNITTFTGKDSFSSYKGESVFSNLRFNASGELIEFSRTITYHPEVMQTDNFEKSGNGIILKSVSVTLKGATEDKVISLEIDNAKEHDNIDYSEMFVDADGLLINGIDIAQAMNDNITLITNYKKDENGNYKDESKTETIVIGSIKDIQSGNPVKIFKLSDKVTYERDDNGDIIIKDNSVDGLEVERIYGEDGKFSGGTINILNPDETISTITLTKDDSFKINSRTGEITIGTDLKFGGISKQQILKKVDGIYSVKEIIALASVEDMNKSDAAYISFEAEKFEQNENTIKIIPDSDNKITVNFGKYLQDDDAGHKAGDYKKAYEITLDENEVLTITKTAQGYEIKDDSGYLYTFKEDGSYRKEKDGIITYYDSEGNIIPESEIIDPDIINFDPDDGNGENFGGDNDNSSGGNTGDGIDDPDDGSGENSGGDNDNSSGGNTGDGIDDPDDGNGENPGGNNDSSSGGNTGDDIDDPDDDGLDDF